MENNLAELILSKLMIYNIFDPDEIIDGLDKKDLKYYIYDLYDDENHVEDLLKSGYDVDTIVEDDELLEEIIELTSEPNLDLTMNDIDNMMNLEYEELLEKKLDGKINL